jgi:glycosyltransferase involved in cell wall biosynthesis
MRRILLLGPVDISKDFGPKVHFFNLAVNFEKLGLRTKCIIYSPEDNIIDETSRKLNIKFLPNPLIGNKIGRLLKYLLIIPIMIKELFSFKPQIIYFRFSPPAFLYLMVLKLLRFFTLNYKVIAEFNDWIAEERAIEGEGTIKVKLVNFLQIKSAFLSDYIRVVVPGLKERLINHGIDAWKIAVIENGTDIYHFNPINKKEAKELIGVDPDYLYVGFIGNFAVWQGLDYLLPAIPQILKIHKNVKFLLVGDGPLMPKTRKEVSKFEKEKVILTGSVPYQEANLYINAFDIGVAPFIRERNDSIGLSPLKIRDYAACGIPVVTTRIKGLEIVEKYYFGILVPPDDSEALSKAIIKLIENRDLRSKMGKRSRKLAEKRFSWKNVAAEILNIIDK